MHIANADFTQLFDQRSDLVTWMKHTPAPIRNRSDTTPTPCPARPSRRTDTLEVMFPDTQKAFHVDAMAEP